MNYQITKNELTTFLRNAPEFSDFMYWITGGSATTSKFNMYDVDNTGQLGFPELHRAVCAYLSCEQPSDDEIRNMYPEIKKSQKKDRVAEEEEPDPRDAEMMTRFPSSLRA